MQMREALESLIAEDEYLLGVLDADLKGQRAWAESHGFKMPYGDWLAFKGKHSKKQQARIELEKHWEERRLLNREHVAGLASWPFRPLYLNARWITP